MGLFNNTTRKAVPDFLGKIIKSPFPTEHLDPAKRYDIYCYVSKECRLYANVRLIALKVMGDIREGGFAHISFLEIEASDGTRALIPLIPIHAICEHGTKLIYEVVGKSEK